MLNLKHKHMRIKLRSNVIDAQCFCKRDLQKNFLLFSTWTDTIYHKPLTMKNQLQKYKM